MSPRMRPISAEGLMEMPPESNVMPLPTCGVGAGGEGGWRVLTNESFARELGARFATKVSKTFHAS